jgi:peptide/nickel transport system substrate-binding protein
MRRACVVVVLLHLVSSSPAIGQSTSAGRGTVVIVTPREATSPVPTLFSGDAANRELSDLMFLRLADLPSDYSTTDEARFVPRLARAWRRKDSTTLVFELDPRARWQDGHPFTSRDVVVAIERAKAQRGDAQLTGLVSRIRSVTADGDHRVVFRFTAPYSEQLYDAVYHVPPLPAHLTEAIPADSLTESDFAANPVGNGPYRWKRRVPGQLIEVEADSTFFEGRPGPRSVVFLIARDASTRLNLLLSGDADVVDNVYQFSEPSRLLTHDRFKTYPLPSLSVGYLLFNHRDPSDTARPHPILGDVAVRRALTLALDRAAIVRAALGPSSLVPGGPVSPVLGNRLRAPVPGPADTAAARRMLALSGWADHDDDGVLDKDGQPLHLTVIFPSTSATRRQIVVQVQEQFRSLGVALDVQPLEPPLYTATRRAGKFDLDLYAVNQDPTPSGLVQSWSCGGQGGSNVGHYCDPAVDSLLGKAATSMKDAPRLWREAVVKIGQDAPAIFLYAPINVTLVDDRFQNVALRSDSPWSEVWKWRLRTGRELPRDLP